MKKKFAIILVFCFSLLSILTGCNLFDSNNYRALSSIVATNGDVKITRQELINAYNSGGYQYSSIYGLSQEETFKKIINELIDDSYYSSYIEAETESYEQYKLTSQDYSDVVAETWDYISQGMETYREKANEVFGYADTEHDDDGKSSPEFATQEQYKTKFELLEDGRIAYIEDDSDEHEFLADINTDEEALSYAQQKFSYERQIHSSSLDYKKLVWKQYLSALKQSQSYFGYGDMTDSAVFNREVERIFKIVLKNAKQTKFQEQKTLDCNFYYDEMINRYIVNDKTLEKMVDYYKSTYETNQLIYRYAQNAFYKDVTGTTNRGNYVYFGEKSDEVLITCSHILIKLSDEQTSQLEEIENSKLYQGKQKEDMIAQIVSADNTYAYERSLLTGEVVDEEGISVAELYNKVLTAVGREGGIEQITKTFNSYLYKYNVDPGIINAQFDYVVGTKTSAMVESFTDAVRELYDDGNGQVGGIKMVFEDGSSYKGYHIILYTGTLDNTFASMQDLSRLDETNIYSILSNEYTSLSYNETMFEFVYDQIKNDTFSTYKTELIKSLINGKNTEYIVSNYKDLYSN